MWQIWLIAAGFFLILEIATTGFLVFWFSIAALITMIFSFIVKSIYIQIALFVFFSVILLFATRPFAKKLSEKETKLKTNAFSIEGKKGKVLVDINPNEGLGQIKVNGEIWSAKSIDNTLITKNSDIRVLKIDGVKAVVEPLNK